MRSATRPTLSSALAFIACLCAGLVLHFSVAFDRGDRLLLDLAFSIERQYFPEPANNDIVLVGIDENFLAATREPLALMHRSLDRLFSALAAGQPRVVGLDIVLPDKSFSFLVPVDEPDVDYDAALAGGLLRLGAAAPLVTGEIWDQGRGRFRSIHPAFASAAGQWAMNRPDAPAHLGSALVCPDADGNVRDYPGAACQPGNRPTLAARLAHILDRPPPGEGLIDYGLGIPFSYLPAGDLVAWHQAGDARLVSALKGRIVLVGAILDNEDRMQLPQPLAQWEPGNLRLPGVIAQAQILRSITNTGLIPPASPAWALLGIALAATLALGQRFAIKLALFGGLAVVTLLASFWLLRDSSFLRPLPIIATGALALLVSGAISGHRHWRERRYLERTFGGYVSPQVLRGIIGGSVAPDQSGQKRTVCVLFSDIRSFTTLSEQLAPDVVVTLLNRYFDRMTQIVHRHGGMVDKFIGDGMMALFGAPQSLPCPEKNALEASQEMMIALVALNREFAKDGLPQLSIGIGLHTGDAVIGHIGSNERHEYTAIGDAVNVASRLADLPKTTGFPIVCSESVAKGAGHPPFLADAGMQALKGHTAMRVYGWNPEVLGAL